MSDSKNEDDCWMSLSGWEQQIYSEIEEVDNDRNANLIQELDSTNKRIWSKFQNTAQCVALLYKGNQL